MKPSSLLSVLLAVAVLAAASPGRAEVPLKELTQEKIRAWAAIAVKAGRDDPARADFWKQVDALLVIDPDRIVYEQDKGTPVNLVWECKPRRELDGEERLQARRLLRQVFDFAMYRHDKGLVAGPDAELLDIVTHLEVGPNQGRVVQNPEECERLRREFKAALLEIERLRLRAAPPAPGQPPAEPREARRYIMVVQPSSMIYYDCPSHCWLPGPASVLYYPAGPAEEARPRPPAFIPPPPTPDWIQPPALKPSAEPTAPDKSPKPSAEKQAADVEEAGRVFWVGYRSYWQGDYDRALASFDSSVRIDGEDARSWYFKALSERALGDMGKAEESARRGRELHAAQKPKADLVSAALERVQGQERRFLNAPEVLVSDAKEDH